MRKTIGLLAASLLAGCLLGAASPQPSPAPTPAGFSDPAMKFVAPAGFTALPVAAHRDPTSFGGRTTVAAFVKDAGQLDERLIVITMDDEQGSLNDFEGTTESTLHSQAGTLFVDKKQLTALSNGMPAYWVGVSVGSGFHAKRIYQYEWVDGVRGVIVSESARMGELGERQAKADLANLTAVAFPVDRYRE